MQGYQASYSLPQHCWNVRPARLCPTDNEVVPETAVAETDGVYGNCLAPELGWMERKTKHAAPVARRRAPDGSLGHCYLPSSVLIAVAVAVVVAAVEARILAAVAAVADVADVADFAVAAAAEVPVVGLLAAGKLAYFVDLPTGTEGSMAAWVWGNTSLQVS